MGPAPRLTAAESTSATEGASSLDVVDGKTLKVIDAEIPMSGHREQHGGRPRRPTGVCRGIIEEPGGVERDRHRLGSSRKSATDSRRKEHHAQCVRHARRQICRSRLHSGIGTVNVIDAQSEQPAWTLEMDLGVRPMTFSWNPDGSTKSNLRAALRLQREFAGWVRFCDAQGGGSHQESGCLRENRPCRRGIEIASHGMAVTSDGKTLVVCSRLNNFLYLACAPRLEVHRRRRARRKGSRLGHAHPRRQNRLRGKSW